MTYSIDIINLFINKFINNDNLNNISKSLNVSSITIKRWIYKYSNNIVNKIPVKDLCKNKIIHGSNKKQKYKDITLLFVYKNEGCSLDDIYNHLNKSISKSSICRLLKENNITRKRCNTRVICKDLDKLNEIRIDFSKKIINKDFVNYEFIDETSFCINDIHNYGYSEKGKEILKITKHSKNKERLTLLSSMSKDTIKYTIIKGSVDSDIYLKFINDNKDNYKDRTLVQDNARIHHSKKVKNYCLENNINMVYNPPYTPEFNPIELIFNKLKT